MSKYILTPGQKRQPLVGKKEIKRGRQVLVQKVTKVFEPGKAVPVDDDIDMSEWVKAGVLSEATNDPRQKKTPTGTAGTRRPDPEHREAGARRPSGPRDVAVRDGNVKAEAMAATRSEKAEEEDKEDEADYEKTKDGKFKCLRCGKILKTEAAIIRHIESKHG